MLEEDFLVVAGDEVAGDDRADAGAGRPLDEVVDEGRGKLAEAESVFLNLLREEVEGRGWFAVGGCEVEAAEANTGLEVDPEETAALKVRSLLAGHEEVAVLADLDRDAGAVEHHREGVGEAHIAAVVEDAAGDEEFHQLLELLVAKKIFRGRPGELLKVREIARWKRCLEKTRLVVRAGRRRWFCWLRRRCGRGLLKMSLG